MSVLVFVNVELEVLYISEVLVARIGNGNSIEEDSACIGLWVWGKQT